MPQVSKVTLITLWQNEQNARVPLRRAAESALQGVQETPALTEAQKRKAENIAAWITRMVTGCFPAATQGQTPPNAANTPEKALTHSVDALLHDLADVRTAGNIASVNQAMHNPTVNTVQDKHEEEETLDALLERIVFLGQGIPLPLVQKAMEAMDASLQNEGVNEEKLEWMKTLLELYRHGQEAENGHMYSSPPI
jgi:hypothetical protein